MLVEMNRIDLVTVDRWEYIIKVKKHKGQDTLRTTTKRTNSEETYSNKKFNHFHNYITSWKNLF